jgi:hypothetical protein
MGTLKFYLPLVRKMVQFENLKNYKTQSFLKNSDRLQIIQFVQFDFLEVFKISNLLQQFFQFHILTLHLRNRKKVKLNKLNNFH